MTIQEPQGTFSYTFSGNPTEIEHKIPFHRVSGADEPYPCQGRQLRHTLKSLEASGVEIPVYLKARCAWFLRLIRLEQEKYNGKCKFPWENNNKDGFTLTGDELPEIIINNTGKLLDLSLNLSNGDCSYMACNSINNLIPGVKNDAPFEFLPNFKPLNGTEVNIINKLLPYKENP